MCRITLTVGDITVKYEPADCDGRCHVRAKYLLGQAASVAVALEMDSSDDEPATPVSNLGFTAHLELDPERNIQDDLSEWFEESP